MACDKATCRTCNQIKRFRSFRDLLPESAREDFTSWFNEVYGDLEMAELDFATSQVEWRQDNPRYTDETELRYKHRLLEWEEYKNEH